MYEAQVFARVVPCSVKPKKRSNIDIRYQAINSKIQTRSGGVGVQNFVAWDSCPKLRTLFFRLPAAGIEVFRVRAEIAKAVFLY